MIGQALTLKELSVLHAKKQPHQVDQLTQDAPILDMLPWESASHDTWNIYEEVDSVEGAGFVELDAPLPQVGVTSELKKLDLSVMGGQAEVAEDKAQAYGGPKGYFAKKMPVILRQSGMNSEYAILYKNLRQFAIDHGKVIDAGSETATNYSIIAARFIPGETTGIYSPKGFSTGATLNVKPINGGNLYKNEKGVLVYGVRLKGYFGFQIANTKSVAAIVNINKNNIPTADQIDDLLSLVRASANTHLFMHPHVQGFLHAHKGEKLNITVKDKDMDRRVEAWNTVPITTSWNFKEGVEEVVAVA